jgi:hypothetical protein
VRINRHMTEFYPCVFPSSDVKENFFMNIQKSPTLEHPETFRNAYQHIRGAGVLLRQAGMCCETLARDRLYQATCDAMSLLQARLQWTVDR